MIFECHDFIVMSIVQYISSSSPVKDDLVFKVLKGCSLFKKETKLQAIVDFLRLLSSSSTVFWSGDPSTDICVEILYD